MWTEAFRSSLWAFSALPRRNFSAPLARLAQRSRNRARRDVADRRLRGGLGCQPIRPLDLLVDLRAMHRDVARRFDPHLHLVAFDRDDHDADVVPDHDRLIDLATENQHPGALLGLYFGARSLRRDGLPLRGAGTSRLRGTPRHRRAGRIARVLEHDLTPGPGLQVDDDRSEQVHRPLLCLFGDDHDAHDHEVFGIFDPERRRSIVRQVRIVIFEDRPRIGQRQRDVRIVEALQPNETILTGHLQDDEFTQMAESGEAPRKLEHLRIAVRTLAESWKHDDVRPLLPRLHNHLLHVPCSHSMRSRCSRRESYFPSARSSNKPLAAPSAFARIASRSGRCSHPRSVTVLEYYR